MKPLLKRRSWVWFMVALVAVLGLAAVGCSSLDQGSTTTLPGAATTEVGVTTTAVVGDTTTLPPAVTVTSVKVDASEDLLSNGRIRACGIIKEVTQAGGVRRLKIDYVDFLTGAPADAAAVADGVIVAGEHVDNDYYVRNNNTKLRTFTVSNSVVITTYSRVDPIDAADPPVSWTTFWNFWNLIGPPLPADSGMDQGLWWIERDSGTNAVVAIEQQWVP